jgi:hypothetical protein
LEQIAMTKTAAVGKAVSLKNKKTGTQTITKPSEILSAVPEKGRSLSLPAAKVYNLLLGVAQGEGFANKRYVISKKELRRSHNSNDRLSDLLKELHSLSFSVRGTLDGKSGTWWMNLLSPSFQEDGNDDTGNVHFKLPVELTAILQESNQWAILLSQIMQRFTSLYALRLYEIGCLYAKRDEPFIWMTPDELRNEFVVPEGAYGDWANMRRKVLDVAIAEVNELAEEFSVALPEDKIRRQGRKVVKFCLVFLAKPTAKEGPKAVTASQIDLDITSRALRALEQADLPARGRWYALARERGCRPVQAYAAKSNWSKWVAWVAEDILKEG